MKAFLAWTLDKFRWRSFLLGVIIGACLGYVVTGFYVPIQERIVVDRLDR